EQVQLDGSHHDWFEGRGKPCVLMGMIDDATGRVLARVEGSETTASAMSMLRRWSLAYGLPWAPGGRGLAAAAPEDHGSGLAFVA
ncbi:MAG: hypothetical protein IT440_06135, partial [Phycisphaeraceae bacterium]|nr:hypothetical protein [Phycisphaeraceae bacterium]